jgi:polyisoprenoid-binding protein YceI/mono/diheme cytochrome c family protein
MSRLSSPIFAILLLAPPAAASTYRLSESGNAEVRFTVDAPLDSIVGVSRAIRGSVTFDPDTLAFGPGEVTADSKTFQTGIGLRDEDLRDQFFEADRFPEIALSLQGLSRSSSLKLPPSGKLQTDITAGLNIHGTNRTVTFPATLSRSSDGNTIAVHASFPVVFADYGIKRPQRLFLKLGEIAQVDLRATFVLSGNSPSPAAPSESGVLSSVTPQPAPPPAARRFQRRALPKALAAQVREHVEHFDYPFNTSAGRGERLMYDPSIGGSDSAATCAGCHGTTDERFGIVDEGFVHPDRTLFDAAHRGSYWQGFAKTPGKAASICAKMFMRKPEGLDEGKQADLTAYLDRISPDKTEPAIDYRVLALTRKSPLDQPVSGNPKNGRKLTQRFCEGCHAVGAERPPLTPGLYEADYLVQRVRHLQGTDAQQMPPIVIDRLTDSELRDIVTYLAGDPNDRIFDRHRRTAKEKSAAR